MTAAVLSPLYTDNNNSNNNNSNSAVSLQLHNNNNDDDDSSSSVPSLSEDMVDNDDAIMMQQDNDNNNVVCTTTSCMTLRKKPGGLTNLGNTCYMNAALQALASIEMLQDALVESAPLKDSTSLRESYLQLQQSLQRGETVHPGDFKKEMDGATPLFVGYRQQDSHEFLTTLLDLLHQDYEADEKEEEDESSSTEESSKEESSEEAMETEQIKQEDVEEDFMETDEAKLEHLPSLSQLEVHDIGTLLHGSGASSAIREPSTTTSIKQEPHYKLVGGRKACSTLVELQQGSLAETVEQKAPMCAQASAAFVQEEDTATPVSPIDKLFTTEVCTRLTCDSCKYTRTHTETHRCLSLEIEERGGSVREGLAKFFAPQKLEIKCEKCFCETATQISEIAKLPKCMLLHFKRFIVDVSPDWSSVTYRKNTCEVEFGSALQGLEEFCAPTTRAANYKISSVIHHIGSSASCGHYTADSFRKEEEWMRFNDARVCFIKEQEALQGGSRRTAYMVLYEMQ